MCVLLQLHLLLQLLLLGIGSRLLLLRRWQLNPCDHFHHGQVLLLFILDK
jgi:hypothetical protein